MGRSGKIFLVLFLIYLGMIAWCCFGHFESLPDVKKDFFGIPTDKVVHFVMFLPFVILGYPSFRSLGKSRGRKVLIFMSVLLAGALIAGATEVGQSLTDYRSGDPMDLLADMAGLVTGAVLTLIATLINKRRTNR